MDHHMEGHKCGPSHGGAQVWTITWRGTSVDHHMEGHKCGPILHRGEKDRLNQILICFHFCLCDLKKKKSIKHANSITLNSLIECA